MCNLTACKLLGFSSRPESVLLPPFPIRQGWSPTRWNNALSGRGMASLGLSFPIGQGFPLSDRDVSTLINPFSGEYYPITLFQKSTLGPPRFPPSIRYHIPLYCYRHNSRT